MPSRDLSPEAYGVLQALDHLGTIRVFESSVERELAKLHFVEKAKGRLIITKKGREAAESLRTREIKRIRKHKKPLYLDR